MTPRPNVAAGLPLAIARGGGRPTASQPRRCECAGNVPTVLPDFRGTTCGGRRFWYEFGGAAIVVELREEVRAFQPQICGNA
jgi:hypothetical protein